MGRGDKGEAAGKAEPDETVLTDEAVPAAEISLTAVPLDETTSTREWLGVASGSGTKGKVGAPRPQVPPAEPGDPGPEDPAAPAAVTSHRRGPGIWLPLLVFVVLLAAGAIAGSLIVPGAGPAPGAEPPAAAARPSLTQPSAGATPSGPVVPTPPPRPADQLAAWAQRISTAVDVPPVALQAYGYAWNVMREQDPSCHLGWTTLAAIGQVESAHGQSNGAVLQSTGRSAPLIVGPVLDGKNGRALVNDTDAGAYDGDTTFDRAMGPMALTPSVWRSFGIDADGDGILDPYDIDDASMALARLLCSGGEDLSQRAGWDAAVARHHAGSAYAKSVFTSADSYGQRTRDMG